MIIEYKRTEESVTLIIAIAMFTLGTLAILIFIGSWLPTVLSGLFFLCFILNMVLRHDRKRVTWWMYLPKRRYIVYALYRPTDKSGLVCMNYIATAIQKIPKNQYFACFHTLQNHEGNSVIRYPWYDKLIFKRKQDLIHFKLRYKNDQI